MTNASYDLGVTALKTGNFADAVTYLEAAVEAAPASGAVRHDLALALRHSGREGEAILQATHALARAPALRPAARLLTYLLSRVRLRNPCGIDPVGLAAAFNFIDVDHQILAATALAYLKGCTALGEALMLGGARDWDAAAGWLLSSRGRVVLRDPLLRKALSAAANTDLDIERLLTAFRKALLMSATKDTLRKAPVLEFACVLARQMNINEYVFAVSDEEGKHLESVFIKPQSLRDGSRAAAENLLLKALYAPVWSLMGDKGAGIDGRTVRPTAIGDFVTAQLLEKRAETESAENIGSLGAIGDKISKNVARLYEENPYPRWLSLHAPTTGSRREQLAAHFTGQETAFMEAPYNVLIAGSGTGQQAVDAALGYGPGAALTAIDLSLASLGYAKHMAERFGAENLRFMQCDILNAGLLDQVFDIIECVGVLHHMADPLRGWKALIDRLQPGGLMKIGLYSRAARRTIATLRDEIEASGLTGDTATIRAYRQKIIAQGDAGSGSFLRQSADFFSLSNFRDLMFHVSEQHLTIPEISAFMAENRLTFHGFQLPLDIAEGYPQEDMATNLERWRTFEDANPDTFKGMYIFWCAKA